MMKLLNYKAFRGGALAGIYLVAVLGILASGHDDDDGDGDGGTTYNYSITSANFFTGGQQVAVMRYGITGSCFDQRFTTSSIRVGADTVVVPGSISFSFTTGITPPMFESVYIDNNASGNLDNGDRVWGDDPNDLYGFCFDSLGLDQTFDWEDIAVQIQTGLGLSRPSIIYTGPDRTFRGETALPPGSLPGKFVFVNADGYGKGIAVTIDIRPAGVGNANHPGFERTIPVAVLGSIRFDATQINSASVRFGKTKTAPVNDGVVEDVNSDGFMDRVFLFESSGLGVVCGDTVAVLKGETFDGTRFGGRDGLKTVECDQASRL